MIPLCDTVTTRKTTFINMIFCASTIIVFLFMLSSQENANFVFRSGGFRPGSLADTGLIKYFFTAVGSMLVHSSVAHILLNIWYLYIFGRTIEEAFGKLQYLLLFVFCGLAALFAQTIALSPEETQKAIFVGASGAISGILGAYLISFPRAKIIFLMPLIITYLLINIPSFFVIVFWYLSQLIPGLLGSISHGVTSVAWWGHLGGFVAGICYAIVYRIFSIKLNS